MKYTVLQDFELDGTKFTVGSTVEFADSVAGRLVEEGKIVDASKAAANASVGGDASSTTTNEEEVDDEAENEQASADDASAE